MSIKDNFPSVGPSLSLNFARSKTLDPRITFSRASSSGDATYMNENGLIVTAAADEPRFDHKYENGVVKSLGLLVEEQRTNILQQSVATTSNWTGGTSDTTFSNLSLNALGIFPGVEVTSTTGQAWHRRTTGFNIPFVSGTEYAVTFYYREGTSGSARLQFRYNSQESYVQGPADGSAWSTQQTIGSITDVTTTLMDGQSTYKTTYSFTPNFTGNADMGIGLGSNSAGTTIIALGGQVEAGGFPTSYIPTSGSQKTRSPDNVSMTGTNFSDWYNQSEGTVYADTRIVGVQTGRYDRLWAITNSNFLLEGISVFVAGPSFQGKYVSSVTITNSATEQVSGTIDVSAITTPKLKSAFAFKQNDCASGYNGDLKFVDNTVDLSTFTTSPDRLLIGQPQRYQGYSCMTISQLTYYPKRLTNTQLQNLTK